MNADYHDFKYKALTEKIIKIFYEVGLLLNFAPEPEIKRKVFDNFEK